MSGIGILNKFRVFNGHRRLFSNSRPLQKNHQCQLLVVGGGSGGCTMAAKFARRLGKDKVIVIEPSETHYYQPLYTLIGAGIKKLSDTRRRERDVLPTDATWLRDSVETFRPEQNKVLTRRGDEVSYEFMVVAVGLSLDFDKVPGMRDALDSPDSRVSTIYSPQYVEKTWSDLQVVTKGELLFTYPTGPVKCPGAPQKICYLADSHHRRINNRSNVNISYYSPLPVIFGVKKYADALWGVAQGRDIRVHLQRELVEIRSDSREAVFAGGEDRERTAVKYDLLHVVPPNVPPACLRSAPRLANDAGLLDVDKHTLRHVQWSNVFGIGDCTNTPNSKTVAAVASQCYVLEQQLLSAMSLGGGVAQYCGYGACPLVTSHSTAIMAEFDYNLAPLETLPVNQAKERTIFYYMKHYLFPFIYWQMMLKGYWHGPSFVRKFLNPTGRG